MHVRIAHQAHCQRKLPTQHCHNTLWPSLYLGVIQHKPYTTNWPQAFITSGFALFYYFFLNIYIYFCPHSSWKEAAGLHCKKRPTSTAQSRAEVLLSGPEGEDQSWLGKRPHKEHKQHPRWKWPSLVSSSSFCTPMRSGEMLMSFFSIF